MLALVYTSTAAGEVAFSPPLSTIKDYIESLPSAPAEAPGLTPGQPSAATRVGDYECRTVPVREVRSYDQLNGAPKSDPLWWPGAILEPDGSQNGGFTEKAFRRAPLILSTSLQNLSQPSVVMDNPSLSSFRRAHGELLGSGSSGVGPVGPADIHWAVEEVHSEEQLAFVVGGGVGLKYIAEINSEFDWDRTEVRSRWVLKFSQNYYTIDVDMPADPASMFAGDVSLHEVEDNLTAAPVFVRSITYGRMFVLVYESEYSSDEVRRALDAEYNRFGFGAAVGVSDFQRKILSSGRSQGFILGGSAEDAAPVVIQPGRATEFIEKGAAYSSRSPGEPIAYKLSSLADGSSLDLSFGVNYPVQQCARVSQNLSVVLRSIEVKTGGDGPLDDHLELSGRIWAESGDQSLTMFDQDSDSPVSIEISGEWKPPDRGQIGGDTLKVRPQAGETLILHAEMIECDGYPNSDDPIGSRAIPVPFENGGWTGDETIQLLGAGNTELVITISLVPI